MVFPVHTALDTGSVAVLIMYSSFWMLRLHYNEMGSIMIALACDHGGYALMKEVKSYLDSLGYDYSDFGAFSEESCDYPDIAVGASRAIAGGECTRGIFICGTGIGMEIVANKIGGIRAALCSDCYSAEMARRHNDANVLTLGERVVGAGLALKIVEVFLNTEFDGGRHGLRVDMIKALDENR